MLSTVVRRTVVSKYDYVRSDVVRHEVSVSYCVAVRRTVIYSKYDYVRSDVVRHEVSAFYCVAVRRTVIYSKYENVRSDVVPQLLQSMRSCQVGLNSIQFKTLKTAKIVLTFLLISQE